MSKSLSEFVPELGPLRRIGVYRVLHYTVLTVGLGAMMALSVPELRASAGFGLTICLWICFTFFAIEWIVRGAVAARDKELGGYLLSNTGLVDAIAVLPIPIALALGVSPQTAWLLASLWLLKLAPLIPGLSLLGRVISTEARPLTTVLAIFLIVLFLAAVVLHVLERHLQPEKFGSLPSALWWAVTTMTTTGYGDSVPETQLGRVVGGVVMLMGLGLAGLWTGIMATGFAAESRRRDFIQNWELVTKVPFLRSLDPAAIIDLTRMLRRMDVPERTVVVRRGRAGDCMYFIASGEVEVKLEPHPVRLGAGSFFGEVALLGGGVRNATVTTTHPSTLLILELTDFRTFAAHHPDLAHAVEAEALRRGGQAAASVASPQLAGEARPEPAKSFSPSERE